MLTINRDDFKNRIAIITKICNKHLLRRSGENKITKDSKEDFETVRCSYRNKYDTGVLVAYLFKDNDLHKMTGRIISIHTILLKNLNDVKESDIFDISLLVRLMETVSLKFNMRPVEEFMEMLCIKQENYHLPNEPASVSNILYPMKPSILNCSHEHIMLVCHYISTLEDPSIIFKKGSIKDYVNFVRGLRNELYPNNYRVYGRKFISTDGKHDVSKSDTIMDYIMSMTYVDYIGNLLEKIKTVTKRVLLAPLRYSGNIPDKGPFTHGLLRGSNIYTDGSDLPPMSETTPNGTIISNEAYFMYPDHAVALHEITEATTGLEKDLVLVKKYYKETNNEEMTNIIKYNNISKELLERIVADLNATDNIGHMLKNISNRFNFIVMTTKTEQG